MSLITLEPDMNIEPGHQWLVLPATEEGRALFQLLGGTVENISTRGGEILLAHDYLVDRNIVALINQLAHVRFSAPDMMQLTMAELVEESKP